MGKRVFNKKIVAESVFVSSSLNASHVIIDADLRGAPTPIRFSRFPFLPECLSTKPHIGPDAYADSFCGQSLHPSLLPFFSGYADWRMGLRADIDLLSA